MPLEPLFHPFRPLIEDRFVRAKNDAGTRVGAVELRLEEEPHGLGTVRAQFLVFEPAGPVRITWNGIASLWAFAQGAGRLSRRMFDGSRSGLERLVIGNDPEIERGLDSFELALRFCTQHPPIHAASPDHWPRWAPEINPSASPGSDDHTGNSFFLGALAWIFRHELAHIVLNHASRQPAEGLSSQACETEADLAATNWLRSSFEAELQRPAGARPNDNELQLEQRAIAVGLGLIWVALFESDQPQRSSEHPPVADRLFRCLEALALREDSIAAEILSNIIKAWIGPEETWAPPGGYPTTRDALDDAVMRLHRRLME